MGRGQIAPLQLAFIQIQCSVKAMHCREAYTAIQYPDLMQSDDVRDWWAPYQRKYVTDFTTSGAHMKPGNGGFFHHCCECQSVRSIASSSLTVLDCLLLRRYRLSTCSSHESFF